MNRPHFDVARAFWHVLLQERGYSSNLKWVFRENLYHTRHNDTSNFRLVFETQIHPVTLDDVRLVYDSVRPKGHPIVFASLVSTKEFTLCTLLGDEFGTSDDVYVKEWDLYFCAQDEYLSFEEVTTSEQWTRGKAREWKHISGLDYVFCLNAFR